MKSPYSRTRNKQVTRIVRIIALMQDGYWSTRGLALKLGASQRTINRHMAAISHGGVRLKHDGMKRAWTLR